MRRPGMGGAVPWKGRGPCVAWEGPWVWEGPSDPVTVLH